MDRGPIVLEPSPVMAALEAHLPLTLLVDLALGDELSSAEVLETEPGDADWLPADHRLPGPR